MSETKCEHRFSTITLHCVDCGDPSEAALVAAGLNDDLVWECPKGCGMHVKDGPVPDGEPTTDELIREHLEQHEQAGAGPASEAEIRAHIADAIRAYELPRPLYTRLIPDRVAHARQEGHSDIVIDLARSWPPLVIIGVDTPDELTRWATALGLTVRVDVRQLAGQWCRQHVAQGDLRGWGIIIDTGCERVDAPPRRARQALVGAVI